MQNQRAKDVVVQVIPQRRQRGRADDQELLIANTYGESEKISGKTWLRLILLLVIALILLALKVMRFANLYEADRLKHASTETPLNSAEPQDQVYNFDLPTNEDYEKLAATIDVNKILSSHQE